MKGNLILNIKSFNEDEFSVEGIASNTEIDRDFERLSEKALGNLNFKSDKLPMRSMHKDPIGVFNSKDMFFDGKNLHVKGFLSKNVAKAKETWELVKDGAIGYFSIGFRSLKSSWETVNNQEIRVFDSIELLEISLVDVPANSNATINSYKSYASMGFDDFKGLDIREIEKDFKWLGFSDNLSKFIAKKIQENSGEGREAILPKETAKVLDYSEDFKAMNETLKKFIGEIKK